MNTIVWWPPKMSEKFLSFNIEMFLKIVPVFFPIHKWNWFSCHDQSDGRKKYHFLLLFYVFQSAILISFSSFLFTWFKSVLMCSILMWQLYPQNAYFALVASRSVTVFDSVAISCFSFANSLFSFWSCLKISHASSLLSFINIVRYIIIFFYFCILGDVALNYHPTKFGDNCKSQSGYMDKTVKKTVNWRPEIGPQFKDGFWRRISSRT